MYVLQRGEQLGDTAVGLRREQEAGEWRTTVTVSVGSAPAMQKLVGKVKTGEGLTTASEVKGLQPESSGVNLCLIESETASQEALCQPLKKVAGKTQLRGWHGRSKREEKQR